MCVCVIACVRACVCACVCVCVRVCVRACVRACVHACVLTLECPRMHVYDVYVYVCIDRKWVCMHVYMFVSI